MDKHHHEIVQEMAAIARKNFERDGHLMPIAFLHSDYPGQRGLDVIGLVYNGRGGPQAATEHLKKAARKKKADFVMVIQETWMLDNPSQQVRDRMGEEGLAPSDMPERIEGVMFFVETPGHVYQAHVRTIRTSEKSATFGPVELIELDEDKQAAGAFVGILPGNAHKGKLSREAYEQMSPSERKAFAHMLPDEEGHAAG